MGRVTTVLLVDDSETIHEVAALYLEGYRLVSAFTARQGMAALDGGGIDVVLLDVNLPDRSGLDLVDTLRRRWSTLPILMFSSDFCADSVALAIRRGATGFLAKWPENLAALDVGVRTSAGAASDDGRAAGNH